ncbi:MAG: MOSC domain-containing protein [Aquiluna sp.]
MTPQIQSSHPRLLAVCVGQVAPLFVRSSDLAIPKRVLSGIRKTVVSNAANPVYLGDEWTIGEVVLRVTEPREPCYKFNAAVGWSGAAKAMMQRGCCGWYLSVVTPGVLAADSVIDVRPGSRRLSVQQAFRKKSV